MTDAGTELVDWVTLAGATQIEREALAWAQRKAWDAYHRRQSYVHVHFNQLLDLLWKLLPHDGGCAYVELEPPEMGAGNCWVVDFMPTNSLLYQECQPGQGWRR